MEYKELSFFVKANGLKQVITNTTRNTDKTQSLLDLILTNSRYISKAGTLEYYISDHQPIFVVKKKGRDNRPNIEFEGRSYRNFNKEDFRKKLLEVDWGDFFNTSDPNEAWGIMLAHVTAIIDKMCPLRRFSIQNYRPDWVTPELIEQIKDRDYFDQKAKSTGDEDDWNIAKHLRNSTNSNIRQARREFILNELREHKSNYKKFSKTIRSVIPDDKGDARKDILLKHEGVNIPKSEIAHYINEFFINIGKQSSPETPPTPPLRPGLSMTPRFLNLLRNGPFHSLRRWKYLTSLKLLAFLNLLGLTSLNVDSLIGSMLPKIESTCLTTIIGLEIYLEHRQLQ